MEEQCVALAPDLSTSIRRTKPGVDEVRFSFNVNLDVEAKRRYLSLPPDKKLVLFVGRFVPAKGVDVLISALTHLSTDTDLVLVGEGESEEDYRRQIVALGLEDRVYIRGATRDVESYYESCNVFAMSSNYEPFGQTILEAMASGLPLVAFSAQADVMTATEELGLDEFINYADRYCPLEFADGIKTQMAVSVRQRQRQSERVLQQYSWQTLFDDLIK
jgi:glycosyltransferase involved in cell wall biosynthesis